jgi:acetoacetyl-CoA synthetase
MRAFLAACGFEDYDQAWAHSVDPEGAPRFWAQVADSLPVRWMDPPERVLDRGPEAVMGARWFPGGRLNYATHALARSGPGPAVMARSDSRPDRTLSWDDLRMLVAGVRAGLLEAGVGPGDTVAGYLPNIPEALAVMLAAASLGAVWTCCAPEMGVEGCLDRLAQGRPTVLVAVDGYRFGGRVIDRGAEIRAIREGLDGLTRAVFFPYLDPGAKTPEGFVAWENWAAHPDPTPPERFQPVSFDHPLYILYSSGTTGRPKALVHGHGGILVEHFKALALHFDLGPDDRFFWFTTTGWMMWNFCVSGLLSGSTVVLFDGDPAGPDGQRLWAVMESTGTTVGGVGAAYLTAGARVGLRPGAEHDLTRMVTLGATGSPLPAQAAEWVYSAVGSDLMLASFSGGTDVCTGFVGTSPLHPVWAGEISCRCLGAAVAVYDDLGRAVLDQEGELVLTQPLPSMPVGILGDEDGSRYRATYFERFPGVWAHGDRATLTGRGTVVITGRSDGTLNRGGVRLGTAELYSVVEAVPGVADSLAVHIEDPGGGPGELVLFVVEAPEGPGFEELTAAVRRELRRRLSPRHVPDTVVAVPAVPRTLSGKKLEVPVKRLLSGVPLEEAVSLAAVADPDTLGPFAELARRRASGQ